MIKTSPSLPKIFAIIGPTGSGKSEYAVTLAKKIGGEIISADSRQVYRSLTIGTGKINGRWNTNKTSKSKKVFIYKSVPHYCIDYVSPSRQYSVTDFKKDANKAIQDIISRGKTPILCGGTGQYIEAVVFNQSIPQVAPNPKLRQALEKKSATVLFKILEKKDPVRASTIDPHNKRRLIRALEIIKSTGRPVPNRIQEPAYTVTWMYLNPPREELYARIEKRLKLWFKQGVIAEVESLHKRGLPWKRIEEFGLEYTWISKYLRGLISYTEMYTYSLREIQQYAKRQQTWFRKYEGEKG